jgi:hypothetical protein
MYPAMARLFESPMELLTYRNGWEFLSAPALQQLLVIPNLDIEQEYIQIRFIINSSLRSMHININNLSLARPFRHPILNLISVSKKGCNKWTCLLKEKFFNTKNQIKSETKWEGKLGIPQGIYFWNSCYKFTKNIFFDNKIKWFQHQIVRGSLKTNHIVSKFKNISSLCSLCMQEREEIIHLFWDCNITNNFIHDAARHLQDLGLSIGVLNRKTVIFGNTSQDAFTEQNLNLLFIKRYVWISRCIKVVPTTVSFLAWFRKELKILIKAFPDSPKLAFLNNRSYLNFTGNL